MVVRPVYEITAFPRDRKPVVNMTARKPVSDTASLPASPKACQRVRKPDSESGILHYFEHLGRLVPMFSGEKISYEATEHVMLKHRD
jgi:hypothetical protein